jgi:hypothetical protein
MNRILADSSKHSMPWADGAMARWIKHEESAARTRLVCGAGLLLALALAGCGGSHHQSPAAAPSASEASAHTAVTSTHSPSSPVAAPSLSVHLTTPPSEPEAGRLWPITVSARSSNGASVSGTVSYAFVFGGAVVARRPGGSMRGGIFHDKLEFPPRALGYPLTLEVIVQAAGRRGSVSRPVSVRQ